MKRYQQLVARIPRRHRAVTLHPTRTLTTLHPVDRVTRCALSVRRRMRTELLPWPAPQLTSATQPFSSSSRIPITSSKGPIAPGKSPVARDDFEALKQFLMKPETSGERADAAKAIVSTMIDHHVYPEMSGQEAAVMSMVADAMEDYPFVIDVYRALRTAHVAPSPMTLELTADACAHVGAYDTAFDVIKQMHNAVDMMHPSIEIYENAVRACHTARQWMKGKQLLDEIRTQGLETTPETHLLVIETTIACEEITATTRLLQDFFRAFPFLEHDEIQEILEDLLELSIEHGAIEHGVLMRDQLVARKADVGRETYEQLIHLAARQGHWHRARVLLAQLIQAPALPIAAPSNAFTRDVEALLADMADHDVAIPLSVYNAAMRAYGGQTKHDQAVALLRTMLSRGVEPDTVSYAAVIYSTGSDIDASQALLDELVDRRLPMSLDVFHAYVLAASRAKAYETVIARYETITTRLATRDELLDEIAHDKRILSCLAIAYGALDDHDAMLRVFTRMKVNGLVPNMYVYAAAMDAYVAKGQWRHALMLFDHMWQEDGIDHDRLAQFPLPWDAAVNAAIEGEDKERLETLYKQITTQRGRVRPHTAARLIETMHHIPTHSLWSAFLPIEYLHTVYTRPSMRSFQVVNAVLLRTVMEKNVRLAEQVVRDAERTLGMERFNSMTYSLLISLYSQTNDPDKVIEWSERMTLDEVPATAHTVRAWLLHLRRLVQDVEDQSNEMRALRRVVAVALSADDGELNSFQDGADLAMQILRVATQRGLDVDATAIEHCLAMSESEAQCLALLDFVDEYDVTPTSELVGAFAMAIMTQSTPTLEHRLCSLVARAIETAESSEIAWEALAAFCSSASPALAVMMLELLLEREYDLDDQDLVTFLACCATPREGQSATDSVDQLRRVCELIRDRDLPLGARSITFLLQAVLTLSRNHTHTGTKQTAETLVLIRRLLAEALDGSSREELRLFLEAITSDPRDVAQIQAILDIV